jgi:hypothetical protein
MVLFAVAVKTSGYHRDSSSRAISVMKAWETDHVSSASVDLPVHVQASTPDGCIALKEARQDVMELPAPMPVVRVAAALWLGPTLRLRPPPAV